MRNSREMVREKMFLFAQFFTEHFLRSVETAYMYEGENNPFKTLQARFSNELMESCCSIFTGLSIVKTAAGAVPGASVLARNTVDLFIQAVNFFREEKKAKRVIRAYERLPHDNLKLILLQVGVEIFRSFEKQIIDITGERLFKERLRILAMGAAASALAYIANGDDVSISKQTLVKAILSSKEKGAGQYIEYSEKKIFPCEFYSKTEVAKEGGSASGSECRLPCTFEEEYQPTQESEYKYLLAEINVEEESYNILKEMEMLMPVTKGDLSALMKQIFKFIENLSSCTIGSGAHFSGGSGGSGGSGEGGGQFRDSIVDDGNLTQLPQFLPTWSSSTKSFEGGQSQTGGGASTSQCTGDGEATLEKIKEQVLEPILFMVRDPDARFTGREKELEDLHSKVQHGTKECDLISRITWISGLGGIGKTQLVRKYVKQYAKDYDENIIWIDATSEKTIQDSFYSLSRNKRLRLLPHRDQVPETIEDIVGAVYGVFTNKRSLFVFDNAENLGFLEKFLPSKVLKPSDNSPYFLITSRYRERKTEFLDLGCLSSQDAELLLKQSIGIVDNSQEEVEYLTQSLGFFPLAIRQAISYILNRREEGSFNINDFLEQYVKRKRNLIDYSLSGDFGNDYTKTTFVTWQDTISKMASDQEHGRLALEVFNIMAYLHHENIVEEMFLSLAENDQSKLRSAVQLLVKYSMVMFEGEENLLSINPLVQEVMRIRLLDEGESKRFIKRTLELLNEAYNNRLYKRFPSKKYFLSHLEAFLSVVDTESAKNFEDAGKMEKDCLVLLLVLVAEECFNVGDFEVARERLQKALKIQERHGVGNKIDIFFLLGKVYGGLNDYEEQEKMTTLVLNSIVYIDYHGEYNDHNVGKAFNKFCEIFQKSDNSYRIVIRDSLIRFLCSLKRREESPSNFCVSLVQTMLGKAYRMLGNDIESEFHIGEVVARIIDRCFKSGVNRLLSEIHKILYDPSILEDVDKNEMNYLKNNSNYISNKYGEDSLERADSLLPIAQEYENRGDSFTKFDYIAENLYIVEENYRTGNAKISEVLDSLIRLADAYGGVGENKEQVSVIEKEVLPSLEENPDNHKRARALLSLAEGYGGLRKYRKEVDLIEKKVLPLIGEDSGDFVRALMSLAKGYKGLKNYRKEVDLIEKRVLPFIKNGDPFRVQVLFKLGKAHGKLGNYKEKRRYLKEAEGLYKVLYHNGRQSFVSYELAQILMELGITHSILKEYYQVTYCLEQILPNLAVRSNPSDKRVIEVQVRLVNAYRNLGLNSKERNLLDDVFSIIDAEKVVDWNLQDLDQIISTIVKFYQSQASPRQCSGGKKRALQLVLEGCFPHKRIREGGSIGLVCFDLHGKESIVEQAREQLKKSTDNLEGSVIPHSLSSIVVEPLSNKSKLVF